MHITGKDRKNTIDILEGSPKTECAKVWLHEADWQFLWLRSHIV